MTSLITAPYAIVLLEFRLCALHAASSACRHPPPQGGLRTPLTIYLTGPEVFLATARQIGARKRAICARHGLVGVYPADEEHAPDPALPLPDQGIAISQAMERAMRSCDAMIVNLTPFRSPSADVGSAYEMGFMRALGRPIVAYSNDARPFLNRVAVFCGDKLRLCPTAEYEDPDGMAIEHFALHDNLMLAAAVTDGCLITAAVGPPLNATPHCARSSAVLNGWPLN